MAMIHTMDSAISQSATKSTLKEQIRNGRIGAKLLKRLASISGRVIMFPMLLVWTLSRKIKAKLYNSLSTIAFTSTLGFSYIEALQQTIRLLREQIGSLEHEVLWLREMIEKQLAPIPANSASPLSTENEDYDLLNLNASHELPSERRRRLQLKHRKRVESNGE